MGLSANFWLALFRILNYKIQNLNRTSQELALRPAHSHLCIQQKCLYCSKLDNLCIHWKNTNNEHWTKPRTIMPMTAGFCKTWLEEVYWVYFQYVILEKKFYSKFVFFGSSFSIIVKEWNQWEVVQWVDVGCISFSVSRIWYIFWFLLWPILGNLWLM